MRIVICVALAALLAGCESFKLGGVAYCPYGQNCEYRMEVPK